MRKITKNENMRMALRHPISWLKFAVISLFVCFLLYYVRSFISPFYYQVFQATQSNDDRRLTFLPGMAGNHNVVEYLANNLKIRYNVLDNLLSKFEYLAKLELTNGGLTVIERSIWDIYFFNRGRIYEKDNVERDDSVSTALLAGGQVKVTHVTGDLFKLEPTESFKTILPGHSLSIVFRSAPWITAKTDIRPNWFVASHSSANLIQPRIIESTRGESFDFVSQFDRPEQWKRYSEDLLNPVTAESRHMRYDFPGVPEIPRWDSVLPTPLQTKKIEGVLRLDDEWVITTTSDNLQNELTFIAKTLGLKVVSSLKATKVMELQTVSESKFESMVKGDKIEKSKQFLQEGYCIKMSTSTQNIQILSVTNVGVFYGIQTLLSLYEKDTKEILAVDIVDAPRYPYRGLMIDVARNFLKREDIQLLIETMAMYKLNKLHFHLTDDEGWRLEIPGLSELTEVGSRRGYFPENDGLPPQLASGPFANNTGSGFYTREEYRSILRYAKSRHVEVIPEIDMPGHSFAAIHSMNIRYQRLMKLGRKEEAAEFLLADLDDKATYMSVQNVKGNSLNPCMESSLRFVEKILTELMKMHEDISPLKFFHFGGDEVPKNAWTESPICAKFILSHPNVMTSADLKQHFVGHISKIAAKLGVSLQGWEDAFYKSRQLIDPRTFANHQLIANHWQNTWGSGKENRAYELANNGYKVVLSHATHLYFDHPYEHDALERGLYWATRSTDTKKVFGYMPDDFYANADCDFMGKPMSREIICGVDGSNCTVLTKPENIIGIQGHLWGETVRHLHHAHYLLFPRVLALAERAWHKASWEIADESKRRDQLNADWTKFATLLGTKELRRIEKMGIRYRIPVPGAVWKSGELRTAPVYPGLTVVYSTDQGQTWLDVESAEKLAENEILLAVRSHSGRLGRSISIKKQYNL